MSVRALPVFALARQCLRRCVLQSFALCICTHVTLQMQESAAEKMENFMAQVMQNKKSGEEDTTNIRPASQRSNRCPHRL